MKLPGLLEDIRLIPPALLIFPGALYLFFGWPLYRITLAVTAAAFGAFAGAILARLIGLPRSTGIMLAVAGLVLFVVLAVFFKKMALFLLGGLAGFALAMLASALFETDVAFLFWAIMLFLAGGSCAVKFLRPLVIFSTSLLGGMAVWRSLAILLFHKSREWNAFAQAIRNPIGLALLAVLVAFGIFCQATSGRRETKPSPAPLPPLPSALPPPQPPATDTPPADPQTR